MSTTTDDDTDTTAADTSSGDDSGATGGSNDDGSSSSADGSGDAASSGAGDDTSGSGDDASGSGSSNDTSDPGSGDDTSGSSGDSSDGVSRGDTTSGSSDASSASSQSSSSSETTSGGSDSAGDQTPASELALAPIDAASTAASAQPTGGVLAAAAGGMGAAAMDAAGGEAAAVSVSDVIAIGTTVAKIMAASSPDYSMRDNPASVVPKGAEALDITGVAADPHELKITLHFTNRVGMLIVNLPIVVQWRFGGNYKGVGAYITSASAFLDSGADVGAFYKADVDAALTGPFNAGSTSAPIASIDVRIEVKIVDKISPYGRNVVLEGNLRGDGGGKLAQRP